MLEITSKTYSDDFKITGFDTGVVMILFANCMTVQTYKCFR